MIPVPSASPPAFSARTLFFTLESCEELPISSTHKSFDEGSDKLYSTNPSATELNAMDLTARASSAYRIRNLATGAQLDLRDLAKASFPAQFSALVDAPDQLVAYKRHLYWPFSAEKRQDLVQLWKACIHGASYKVKELVNEGANLMARGLFNWTALHYAADAGFDEVCRVILESGQLVDVDARTEEGQTALHLAAKKDNLPVALVLSEFHADLSALDIYELSAYSYTPNTKVSLVAGFLRLRNKSSAHIRKAREVEEGAPLLQPCPAVTKQERDTEDQAACYSVLRLIGKGAFAHVYSAIHKPTQLAVALKCIKKSLLEQQDMIKYVQIERYILSYLTHPFIGKLYASFQTASRLVLVLEYCAGGDLRSQLHTLGCFSEDLAKKYAAEVFLAVEFLHRNGIIYRDLKLENIVLDAKGHIRLIDFGLSKDNMENSEETNSFCGSIGYLAPELVAQKSYSMSIDWYMYGCLLYEMLTGQPPFKTFDVSRLLSLIESGNIQYPSSVSPTAKSLIQGLTAKSPAKRLGSGRSGRSLIKSHAFFAGIDWAQVYRKELEMPIPPLTWADEQEEDEDEAVQAFGYSQGATMFSRVRGWSFGDPSQL